MSTLLERLNKHKDDRGMMANLRCVLVDSKKHRAWPALHRLHIDIQDNFSAYFAGIFATYPDANEETTGNIGTTCRNIEPPGTGKQSNESKLSPTERRFQHLLAADNKEELFERLRRIVMMAKSKGVRINYSQLEADLKTWQRFGGDQIKIKWAAQYWIPEATPLTTETEEGE